MQIKLNDLKRLYAAHADKLEAAALDALRSGWWLSGRHNDAFAQAFAASLGVAACIPVANGTDALEIALRALHQVRAPRGREVIMVANAGGYAAAACWQNGLVPVYADIEAASQLMSIPSAVAALGEHTMAIVATHLYGGVLDVPALRRAIDQAGYGHVPILEDCAQAHGGRVGTAPVGSCGAIGTYSFYPTKNLGALGDGGAIVTSDAVLAEACGRLRHYGWGSKYHVTVPGGRNSRMDEVQAAILTALLPQLPAMNAERARICARLRDAAGGGVAFVESGPGSVVHLAVVRNAAREALRRHLSAAGVDTEIHYPVLDCDQPGWSSLPMRIGPGGLAVSRQSVREILTLPCFFGMREDEIAHLCQALKFWEGR